MARRQSYIQEAQVYHNRLWAQLMQRAAPRRFVIKAGTLAALGGMGGLNALMAACAGGASRDAGLATQELEAGAFKYSRYPAIEKYNWRSLPWGGTPYVDGKMVLGKSTPANWDFLRNYRAPSTSSFVQALFRLKTDPVDDPNFTYEIPVMTLDLADKVTAAPDYSYYDYHIRPKTFFHDIPPANGRALTAEDAAYSLETMRTFGFHTAPLDVVDHFEALPDKETVRAVMKRPVIWLNHVVGAPDFGIFAREHWEGPREVWNGKVIGSGPFMVTESQASQALKSVRHPRFNVPPIARYAGHQLPFLKELEWAAATGVALTAAYRSKQIDIWTSSGAKEEFDDVLATNADSIIQVFAPTATYQRVELNLKLNRIVQDVKVRRAMNMALDRPRMVSLLHGNMASPSHPVSFQFLGRNDPFRFEDLDQWHQYNPTRAKELLIEAGYPNGFDFNIITSGPATNFHVVLAEHLAAIGVRVNFEQLESTVYATQRTNRTYTGGVVGADHTAFHGMRQVMQEFLPDSPKNAGYIDDPFLTDLVYKAAYTLDANDQMRLLKQINDYAMDQCFAIETFSGFQMNFMQPWVHNMAGGQSGWLIASASAQIGVAWLDDTAPAERRGRLKA